MNIVWTRRISQIFFLFLFVWTCVSALPDGEPTRVEEMRFHFFLYADPLIALSVWLASGALAAAFLWAFVNLSLTIVVGRFFCGWVCPLGSLQQAVGWIARFKRPAAERVRSNTHRRIQALKYSVLIAFTVAALAAGITRWFNRNPGGATDSVLTGSLQIGLLDPICLIHRAMTLALLPLAEHAGLKMGTLPRFYGEATWAGGALVTILVLCVWWPRFYCRYICPLGALLGLIGRWSFWRIGKTKAICSQCSKCERDCEGACSPAAVIRSAECVLCFNCLHVCPDGVIRYGLFFPEKTQTDSLDLGRRGFLVSAIAGLATIPLIRLNRALGSNYSPRLIRPPGSRPEPDFLTRCIRCGQCMRVCPTNIIQPAAAEAGAEGVWSPVLNYRIGTSGCIPTCTACGRSCPTGAIRAVTVDERLGRAAFEQRGPIRMGLAFVDRGRCLPWAMNRPCIVCQEVCPVSPKAIDLVEHFAPIRFGGFRISKSDELTLQAAEGLFRPGTLAVGDIYVITERDAHPRRIVANTDAEITIEPTRPFTAAPMVGEKATLLIRLAQPVVDPRYCIGCGICEHHCPIAGLKAIRVTAENESRHPERRVTLSEIEGERL